jgi:hypothetical protein
MSIQKLWVPGEQLEYNDYSQEQLENDWLTHYAYDDRALLSVSEDMLGVVHEPLTEPAVFASVDLCEVLRETYSATVGIVGRNQDHIGNNVWDYSHTLGLKGTDIVVAVQTVMNADLVQPVRDIKFIAKILQSWKAKGVFIVANTSTLPNCETATIKNLLARELPEIFDGILLPRNHAGTSKITKGSAMQTAIQRVSPNGVEKALHIDDAPHHLSAVAEAVGSVAAKVAVIRPTYESGKQATFIDEHGVDPSVVDVNGSLEAFLLADKFLKNS